MGTQDRATAAASDRTKEQSGALEDRTRTELFELAKGLEIVGYADMSRPELIEAIRRR
jgi:hypothetical protein